jgi:hypothetical protein
MREAEEAREADEPASSVGWEAAPVRPGPPLPSPVRPARTVQTRSLSEEDEESGDDHDGANSAGQLASGRDRRTAAAVAWPQRAHARDFNSEQASRRSAVPLASSAIAGTASFPATSAAAASPPRVEPKSRVAAEWELSAAQEDLHRATVLPPPPI